MIVLFDEAEGADISERDWLTAANKNDVFDFLADEAEDLYTVADGRPVSNEK